MELEKHTQSGDAISTLNVYHYYLSCALVVEEMCQDVGMARVDADCQITSHNFRD